MLNSRESLAQRIANLGDGALKDLLTDLNDSAWQWSRKSDDSSTRNRKTIIGGQVASSSSSFSGSGSGSGPGSGSGSGSSSGTGASSSGAFPPKEQVQVDWNVIDPMSMSYIRNKPSIGSISEYDFSGGSGNVVFDGNKFSTVKIQDAVEECRVSNGNISDAFATTINNASGIFLQLFYAKSNINIKDVRICQCGMDTSPVRISLWESGQDAVQWTSSIPSFSLIEEIVSNLNRGAYIYSNSSNFTKIVSKGWYAIGIDVMASSESIDLMSTQSFASISPDKTFPSLSQNLPSQSQDLPSSFVPSKDNNSIQKLWIELTESVVK